MGGHQRCPDPFDLDRNFTDAIQLTDTVERNSEFIVKATPQEEHAVHLEFVRRFHNYLAAANTIVDNTRALRTRWGNREFDHGFETRLETVKHAPIVRFIHDMRNAMQHSRFPDIHRVTTFDAIPPGPNTVNPRLRLMVSTSALQATNDWSPGARRYIEQAADRDHVDMTVALKRYHEVADSFNDWFADEIKTARRDLLDDFRTRRADLIRLQSQP